MENKTLKNFAMAVAAAALGVMLAEWVKAKMSEQPQFDNSTR